MGGEEAGKRRAEASKLYYQQAYGSIGKDKYRQLMQEYEKMTDVEVKNKYSRFHDMLDEEEEDDDQDMHDLDLFQVKCKPGTEEDLVQKMMNKAAYVNSNPGSYIWNVISAFCRPKRFVGLIFLESNNVSVLETSIKQFKAIKTSTLQKIEFEVFSHLFGDKAPKTHDYKSQDYIKIKTGVYAGDLAQITKVHKNGVIVQVVPRINFTELAKRLQSYEANYARLHTEEEIMKGKNMMLREFMNPRATNLKDMPRPPPAALMNSDFIPYG